MSEEDDLWPTYGQQSIYSCETQLWDKKEDITFLLESMILVSAANIMGSDCVFTLGDTSRHIHVYTYYL